MQQKAHVRLSGVTKYFGTTAAVRSLDLDIPAGSFTTLLGPSGCGKTTTLRMIAGFFDPDEGEILINGKRQNGLPPFKRNVSIVFQEYALFPHMTVFENVAYGLKVRKTPKNVVQEKVAEVLDLLGLKGLERRSPHQLSGGQQQRVALARSIVLEPEVLLMDEPMSNLDAKLRVRLRAELRQLQQRLGITTIYVTHDQEEALSLSDQVAVMDHGTLMQHSDPWELYFRPRNRFVADFVGIANFIPAVVEKSGGGKVTVTVAGQKGEVAVDAGRAVPEDGARVTLMVRPEWCDATPAAQAGGDRDSLVLSGAVESHSFLGSITRYWLTIDGLESLLIVDKEASPAGGALRGDVRVRIPWNKLHLVDENGDSAGAAPLAAQRAS